jgi:hypothetical protein
MRVERASRRDEDDDASALPAPALFDADRRKIEYGSVALH